MCFGCEPQADVSPCHTNAMYLSGWAPDCILIATTSVEYSQPKIWMSGSLLLLCLVHKNISFHLSPNLKLQGCISKAEIAGFCNDWTSTWAVSWTLKQAQREPLNQSDWAALGLFHLMRGFQAGYFFVLSWLQANLRYFFKLFEFKTLIQ